MSHADGGGGAAHRAAWLALGAACLAGPWPLGGHPPWAGVALASATTLALVFAFASRPRSPIPWPGAAVAWALFAAVAFTALQRLPLPCGWIEGVAAESVAHRRAVASLVGRAAPSACTLTHSPAATELGLVRDVSALAAFVAGLLLVGSRRGRSRALGLVALTGGALALVGVGHLALGADALFGVYEPVHASPSVVTPLLNGNNLAGLLILAAPVTFALAARGSTPLTRHALTLLGSLEVLVLVATESRGGILALAAITLVAGAWALRRRTRSPRPARAGARSEIALGFTLALALGGLLAAEGLASELGAEHDDQKLALLERGAALALTAPPLGFGRGAFGQAIAETFPYDRRVEFAENLPIQRASDWGLPFALFFLVTVSAALASSGLRRRTLPSAAASLGLFGLALQNLVDFSLELPGVAIAAALSAAVVASPPGSGTDPRPRARPALARAATLACVGAVLTLGPLVSARSADAQIERLAELARDGRDAPRDAIEEALSLHPRDPAVALLAAHLVRRGRPREAGPFLNRSLSLSPHWAATHVEVARWLLSLSRGEQAALHLARAAELDVRAARELTCELIDAGFAEAALDAAPAGDDGRVFFERAMSCLRRDDPRSLELERLALERSDDVLEAQVRVAERRCKSSDEDLRRLRELTRAHPGHPRPHLALARCHAARGEHEEARAVARAALARMPRLKQAFDHVLRGDATRERRPGGALDRDRRVGDGVSPPPATHAP